VVGFSREFFTFKFSTDIDVAAKAERLRLAFPQEASVLLVVREQASIIRSMYKEFIRNGYARTFSEFAQWLYEQKDRNFVSCLKYDRVYEKYSDLFGAKNVHLSPFELVHSSPQAFMQAVGAALA
jgi:hypothetical protein